MKPTLARVSAQGWANTGGGGLAVDEIAESARAHGEGSQIARPRHQARRSAGQGGTS